MPDSQTTAELRSIAETFTELGERSDNRRKDFSKTLLIIYTPVSSGLVFLSTSLDTNSDIQKISFLIMILSSVLIVLCAILERLGSFLITKTIANTFAKYVRETRKHTTGPLYGKDWQAKLVSSQVYLLCGLLIINMIASTVFVFTNVLS
ncbi:MAG: hypothetical protein JWO54_910 [Candidatus Saccharibacteria bacterium]|nr:hypothetical protein [Candidatus Saccharibacteria bacterium]